MADHPVYVTASEKTTSPSFERSVISLFIASVLPFVRTRRLASQTYIAW